MSPLVVVMTITLLLGLQPITTDLYLPTLPTLQRELAASIGVAQLTLSALIICFGLGQLACGPLSDRFGRRPVLLAGMALYTVASVLAAASRSIEALIAWRALLCATWGGIFFILAGSSFVFIDMLGTSRPAYGLILASCSLAYPTRPARQHRCRVSR